MDFLRSSVLRGQCDTGARRSYPFGWNSGKHSRRRFRRADPGVRRPLVEFILFFVPESRLHGDYFFRRILMVMMVFHEPSGARIEDVKTLWSGLFNSVTSLNLEGVCGLGTGPSVSHVRIFPVISNVPSSCQRWLVMLSTHGSDVLFLCGIVTDGQDLLVGKIRSRCFYFRDEPEPAD